MKSVCFPQRIVAILAAALALPAAASAQTEWKGTNSTLWSDAVNWTAGAPTAGSTVQFGTNSTANLSTNNDIGPLSLQGITNTSLAGAGPSGDVSISGSALTLGAGGINYTGTPNQATRNLSVNTDLTLSAAQDWKLGGTALTLTVGTSSANAVALNGNTLTLRHVGNNEFLKINSSIVNGTSAGALAFLASSGTSKTQFRLSGTNTYSGGTTSTGASQVIQLDAPTVLSGPTIVSGPLGTGNLTLNSAVTNLEAYTTDRSINNNIILGSGATLTATTTIGQAIHSLTINGTVSSLTGNRVILTDSQVTSGGSGDLIFNGNILLGTSGSAGGTFTTGQTATPTSQPGKIIYNGNLLETAGVTSGVQLSVVNGTAALFSKVQFNGQNTYSGGTILSATGGLVEIGSSSTFSGPTLVSGPLGTGTVTFNNTTTRPAIQAINSAQTLGNSIILTSNAEVKGTQNLALSGSVTNSGANRTIFSSNAGTTTLSGPVFLSEASGTGRTLTFSGVSTNNPIFSVSGNISDFNGTGTAGSVIIGGGAGATGAIVTLSGTNTHSGNTQLNTASTLNIGSAGAFGTSTFVINGNGSFDNTSGGALVLSTNMSQSNGSPTFVGTNDLSLGNVALSGDNRAITVSAKTLSIGNVSQDAARNYTKNGAGTLTVRGTDSHSGTTLVTAGTWQLASTGIMNATSSITVNSGAKFIANGTVSSTGAVTINNGGTLAGTGAVSGPVTVNGGGSLAPGTSIETLDVGALTFKTDVNGGSTLAYEINSNVAFNVAADLVNASGNLSIAAGAILSLVDLGNMVLPDGTKFTVISYAGTWDGGTFAMAPDDGFMFASGKYFEINYNDTTGGLNFGGGSYGNYLTITAVVPEASTLLFGGMLCIVLGVAAGGRKLLRRRVATCAQHKPDLI